MSVHTSENVCWTRRLAERGRWEAILCFFLLPFYPLLAQLGEVIRFPERDKWKTARGTGYVTLLAVTALSLAWFLARFLGWLVPGFITALLSDGLTIGDLWAVLDPTHRLPVLTHLASGLLLTPLLNVLSYAALLSYEYPRLVEDSFISSHRTVESDWVERTLKPIIGHKIWSGTHTTQFLTCLIDDSNHFGRAKWLLVDFLSREMDRKISAGGNPRLYDIVVRDWSVPAYSGFLTDNMFHAEHEILWVVDPVDFYTEILPVHVIEVNLSLAELCDPGITRRIQDAVSGDDHELASLLGPSLIGHCPRPQLGVCAVSCAPGACETRFDFVGERARWELAHLWCAFFAAACDRLRGAVAQDDKLTVQDKRIGWQDIARVYEQRAHTVGSLLLPHIDTFRKAACEKKRYIYLGGRTGDDETVEAATRNSVLRHVDSQRADYMASVAPALCASGTKCLFDRLLWRRHPGTTLPLQLELPINDPWNGVAGDTKRLVLGWALRLFRHSSGDATDVKGVFCDAPRDRAYSDSHDIGVYDDRLELSSCRGDPRSITWRLYANQSPLKRKYFPADARRLIEYDELSRVLLEVLAT